MTIHAKTNSSNKAAAKTTAKTGSASRYLLKTFSESAWVQDLSQRFAKGVAEIAIENLSNPAVKALTLAALQTKAFLEPITETPFPIVVVCADPIAASYYELSLKHYLGDKTKDKVYHYPNEGFSPYDLTVNSSHSLQLHYEFLEHLRAGDPGIYFLTARNLLMKHPSLKDRLAYSLQLTVDGDHPPDRVMQQLLAMGYTKVSLILQPGEFSLRGDILDIYPMNADPIRVVFFGDTVESIKQIDVDSQRSIQTKESANILPRSELVLTEKNREALKTQLKNRLTKQQAKLEAVEYEGLAVTIENQLQALDQAFWPDGIDYYAPLLHPEYEALVDVLPQQSILVLDDWHGVQQHIEDVAHRMDEQLKNDTARGRLLELDFQYHLPAKQVVETLLKQTSYRVLLDSMPLSQLPGEVPTVEGKLQLNLQAPEQFQAHIEDAVDRWQGLRKSGYHVFVTSDYPQRILDACREQEVPALYWGEADGRQTADAGKEVIIARHGPMEGFILPDLNIAHYTDADLYGLRRMRRLRPDSKTSAKANKREDADVIQSIAELKTGDYVVHLKHGIGRYVELTQITIDKETREYLSVEYANQDRLHVPADQVNLLARYRGAGEIPPKLNKMGGIEWSTVKKKVKKSVESIARDLVALYAKRAQVTGYQFEGDSPWQVELEESFPYTETPDQWQAILDTKKDMESDKPMDRLICGDVGFGKTEVALRAIFKCVLSGKQSAVLVPTTILAQQHFNTLLERYQPYGVKVGLLSRFKSPKEQKEVIEKLKEGTMDVVVGTHRLLQKDIKFKDLGLLVIDEEHRFGVAHKEKIKHMRAAIDVLTLSATPIPRTLYMSISGVREMSLINTPPLNRAPVQTFVGPYNPAQIRMAILHELDRGGQIYFVHNRVQSIHNMAYQLQQLVPEVRIGIGHGQMNEHELENVMLEFAQRNYDVLLCTTIIESGVDIPNANTMIIDRADRFGLAQLYQLRGRVGRSDVQAYAYCYYDPEKELTEDARNRLRAIREFNALGSGYQIALRDMEIRGVGNILGSEQHGHMIAVGFDMYCEMLKDAIDTLQTGVDHGDRPDPAVIDINVTAFIPDHWVSDRDVKLTEYKRLTKIDSDKALTVIQAEWLDRFGTIPKEALQLVNLVKLRILATELGIPWVRSDEEALRIATNYTLQEWMQLQAKLPPEIGKKARWVPGLNNSQSSTPTLQIKLLTMTGADQVEYLMSLFTHLLKLRK